MATIGAVFSAATSVTSTASAGTTAFDAFASSVAQG
jgi:hypothetical protein